MRVWRERASDLIQNDPILTLFRLQLQRFSDILPTLLSKRILFLTSTNPLFFILHFLHPHLSKEIYTIKSFLTARPLYHFTWLIPKHRPLIILLLILPQNPMIAAFSNRKNTIQHTRNRCRGETKDLQRTRIMMCTKTEILDCIG